MNLNLKSDVRVRGLSNEILLALLIAKEAYSDSGEETMVITSLTDGRHSSGSLHYTGDAVDLRLPLNTKDVINRLKQRLTKDFDVVLEATHIHLEYDPK